MMRWYSSTNPAFDGAGGKVGTADVLSRSARTFIRAPLRRGSAPAWTATSSSARVIRLP